MIVHKLFLLAWLIDLTLFPVLALLDLGFSFNLSSNFYLRFSYLFIVFIAFFYLIAIKGRIVVTFLSVTFLFAFLIGSFKGLIEGHLNSAFLSHVFYTLMPLIMISYGWYFFDDYKKSVAIQKYLSLVMHLSFFSGLAIIILFQFAYRAGFANYNAIGIWNLVFSGPFLVYREFGFLYFALSVMVSLASGKRGTMIAFVAYGILAFWLTNLAGKIKYIALVTFALTFAFLVSSDFIATSASRIYQTLVTLQEYGIDQATSGRWSEAASAISYLNSRIDHWIIGPGFGARFLPWPDRPDYADYYSHYTHFGVVSYVWVGGLFMSCLIYAALLRTGISLGYKAKHHLISKTDYTFVFWLWGIIAISMFGAVLMNNAYLWFIIGCCLNLDCRRIGLSSNAA